MTAISCRGQLPRGIAAHFDFEDGSLNDKVYGLPARAPGTSPASDRFGNRDHALYLQGNPDSYLNLGTHEKLKPQHGTVSLWVKISQPLYKGKGIRHNPIIRTKSNSYEECDEAYYIGYHIDMQTINVNASDSCERHITLYPTDPTPLLEWHHVVMTYDRNQLMFYLNGVLQNKAARGFETRFLKGDSVMVGALVGQLNNRYLNGCVDDIMIFDRVLSPAEISGLFNAPDPNRMSLVYRWLLIGAGIMMFVGVVFWAVRLRVRYLMKKEKAAIMLKNAWFEQENRVLAAQMDPHFIFNSLNSIQELILTNENEKAQNYLSKFARLIRKMLETNDQSEVSLAEETDICRKYLEIESMRFRSVFDYEILLTDDLEAESIFIPHFLVQPLIENALWHGLLPKQGPKKLIIRFSRVDDRTLYCAIEDNGVGRSNSIPGEKRDRKRSLAIRLIEQRLQLMSKVKQGDYRIELTDRINQEGKPEGTRASLWIPISRIKNHVEIDHY